MSLLESYQTFEFNDLHITDFYCTKNPNVLYKVKSELNEVWTFSSCVNRFVNLVYKRSIERYIMVSYHAFKLKSLNLLTCEKSGNVR